MQGLPAAAQQQSLTHEAAGASSDLSPRFQKAQASAQDSVSKLKSTVDKRRKKTGKKPTLGKTGAGLLNTLIGLLALLIKKGLHSARSRHDNALADKLEEFADKLKTLEGATKTIENKMDQLDQQYDRMFDRHEQLDALQSRTPEQEQEMQQLETGMQQNQQEYESLDQKLCDIRKEYEDIKRDSADYIKNPLKAGQERAEHLKQQQGGGPGQRQGSAPTPSPMSRL
jgi:chromosome segregation ATPase